jgi:hypothetical protein
MSEDLDGRLGYVLVIVSRASLAKVLKHPGLLFAAVDARLGPDTSEIAQLSKLAVWPSSTAEEYGSVRIWFVGHDALEMHMNCTVHRSPERLACLHSPIEQPAPRRKLLNLAVRCLSLPRHVPPMDRLVKRECLPDGPGIDSIIEEENEGAPPIAASGKRMVPTSGKSHMMRRKIESVNLGLGEVMLPGNISLRFQFWKPRKSINEVLLPRPRHHSSQV